ncbi:histone deacetylase domain-containing protein [Cytidiella melzeri]|nr:histone deacetylase domain-containing protein [Cytidiella melzeri]
MSTEATTVFLQDAGLRHRFIRSKDTSNVVERPERLRAVNIGVSAAVAIYEAFIEQQASEEAKPKPGAQSAEEALTTALEGLDIGGRAQFPSSMLLIRVLKSTATLDVLDHPAVKFVHGDIEGDVYLDNLIKWARESRDKIAHGGSEIPASLAQGDLYLCPTSMDAIQGALATVCEAVDTVVANSRLAAQDSKATDGQPSPSRSGFVAIRPPGHHCGEDTPSGFCFVNNVVVGAAHAHLNHGVNRAVVFDIDLHHGNGTQALVWQINEETYRQQLEHSSGAASEKPGLQMFYGSLHDILSYPCEDGKPELVQAASASIHGPHGQYIENIHLLPYTSDEHFWGELYEKQYTKLFKRAATFVEETAKHNSMDDVLIFISCGFDACEHEYESMSRHGRKVPVGFYHRFARDAQAFADKFANGRLISVLEGGYSDKALTSGVMAHVSGLAGLPYTPEWWSEDNLTTLEKTAKKRRGGRTSLNPNTPPAPWIERAVEVFSAIGSNPPPVQPVVPPMSMALRDRSKAATSVASSEPATTSKKISKPKEKPVSTAKNEMKTADDEIEAAARPEPQPQKKLPRVILKLGPEPTPAPPTSVSEEWS